MKVTLKTKTESGIEIEVEENEIETVAQIVLLIDKIETAVNVANKQLPEARKHRSYRPPI